MRFLSGKETEEYLEGIVYRDTQIKDDGVDLTVAKIFEPENRGEIDFGGSERSDAEISEIKPRLRNPKDDYGWWELEPGFYLISYNESFKTKRKAFLQPLPRLTRNQAIHTSGFLTKLTLIPLYVGENGMAIKENSRVSRIYMFEG
ncbi:hypothetical protein AKJ54_00905 [candidate division MSBL1 archaeon SCGC-AAA382K21]|uniref:Deoxycytidine triphosphate deaminase n=1 Tax=candidate division MSBL1 archaeon SCGC-AAA382K21 TaxID=1698283 RepID=A0A133VKP4_9EURY|nr:hypothetical protein AKJ54_00905 [candidate division MSBL1 archaeon SCGC-AAA382K21]